MQTTRQITVLFIYNDHLSYDVFLVHSVLIITIDEEELVNSFHEPSVVIHSAAELRSKQNAHNLGILLIDNECRLMPTIGST